MSEQQIIRGSNNDGMEIELRIRGDRILRRITPYLAQIEALIRNQQGNFRIEFDPPIRVENERTREHFWLGTPPLRAVLSPPLLLGVMIVAMEEEVIA